MKRDGIALVTVLLVVMVVGILTTGSLLLSVSNLRLTKNDATATQALAVAQAGSAFWRAELVSLYVHMLENFDDYEEAINAYIAAGNQIACGNYLAIGVDTNRDGTPDVLQGGTLPGPDVLFRAGGPEGVASVRFSTRGSAIVLDSRGSFGGSRARVVDEFSVSTVDVWNNAVFAGNSAANATINGRAEIRGSVHVLGDGLSDSDMALDITGSFGLGNTYKDISNSLGVTADSMRLTTDDPHDLCATLRVKRGYVQMDGSSQIGYDEASHTDQYVDNVTGIYANGNISGGTVNQNVFSVNGMTASYDAGNSFQFPHLDEVNPNSPTSATWREGLQERALVLSLNRDGSEDDLADDRRRITAREGDVLAHGEVYLTSGCDSLDGLFGVTTDGKLARISKKDNGTGVEATGFVLEIDRTPAFQCAKKETDEYGTDLTLTEVSWDPSTNELYVGGTAGVVNFRGAELLLTGSGASGKQIAYKGEGILFAEDEHGPDGEPLSTGARGGRIELEVDFLPASGNAAAIDGYGAREGSDRNVANTYPATAIVALVADENVTSLGAQKRFTTAIYAEDSVNVTKQSLVAGSIVTRTFDAGSNVPTVLYVPNLAERLSDLMPGTGSKIYAVSNVAYSRR